MSTEKIESLISKQALGEFDKLNEKLTTSISSYEKLISNAVKANNAMSGKTSFKGMIDEVRQLEDAEKKLIETQKQIAIQQAKLNQLNTAATLQKQKEAINDLKIKTLELSKAQKEQSLHLAKQREEEKLLAAQKKTASEEDKKRAAEESRMHREKIQHLKEEQAALTELEKKEIERQRAEQAALSSSSYSNQSTGNRKPTVQTNTQVATFIPTTQLEKQINILNKTRQDLDRIKVSQKALHAEYKAGTISLSQYNAKLNQLSIAEFENKKTVQLQTAEIKNTVREQQAAKGSLDQRRAALIRLAAAYDNLSAAERRAPQGQRLQSVVVGLTTQVKSLEEATLRAQRNVGNYPTNRLVAGFSSLWSVLRNIAYIVPGLGIAGLIGLLTEPIINFVASMFEADEKTKAVTESLKKHKEEMKTLVSEFRTIDQVRDSAQGGTASEISRVKMLSSIVQDQTLSYTNRNNALKELQNINKNYFGDLTLEGKSLQALTGRVREYTDALINQAVIKELESDIGKIGAAYFRQSRTVKKAGEEVAAARNKMYQKNGDAFGAFSELADRKKAYSEELESLKPLEDQFKKLQDELRSFTLESSKYKPLETKGGEAKKNADHIKEITEELNADVIKEEIAALKAISRSQDYFWTDRLFKRQQAFDKEEELIIALRDIELRNAQAKVTEVNNNSDSSGIDKINALNELNKQIQLINEKAANDLQKLTFENEMDLLTIENQFRKNQRDADRKQHEEDLKFFKEQAEARFEAELKVIQENELKKVTQLVKERDIGLITLNEMYAKQIVAAKGNQKKIEKAEEEYTNRRKEIELKYAIFVLETEIKTAQEIIKLRKALGQDTTEAEKALSGAQLSLSDLMLKRATQNNDKIKKASKQTLDDITKGLQTVKQIQGEVFNLIGGIIDAQTIEQKNEIQEQIDLIEEKTRVTIEGINAETISEEQKAHKIAIVNARAAAQKQQLELKQRQADERRARFEKAKTIGEIVINTALAVVKALGEGDPLTKFVRAAVIGALGAAQLATAIGTPIPRYATGTLDAKGGPSLVGDGGKSELVIEPDGSMWVTKDRPEVMNIPRHSIILPDARAALESGISGGSMVSADQLNKRFFDDLSSTLGVKLDILTRVVKNKTENHFYPRKDGWQKIKDGRITYLNNNLQG